MNFVSLREIGHSGLDLIKVLSLGIAAGVILESTETLIKKTYNYFNDVPFRIEDNGDENTITPMEREHNMRNHRFMNISTAAFMVAFPAFLSIECKSYPLNQKVQFAMVNALLYTAARATFLRTNQEQRNLSGNHLLSRAIMFLALEIFGKSSKFIIPVTMTAVYLAFENSNNRVSQVIQNAWEIATYDTP